MLKRNYDINREAVRVSYNTPRDSGQDKKNEIGNDLDPVLQRQRKSKSLDVKQAYRTDLPKAGKYDAVVKPFFPAAFATNLTMNALEVLEGTLAMRRSANHVTKLNTRLLESIPGGDIAFMNRMMAMGANSNATCRLNHVSACHIAAMHDNDALDLLLRSGADISRSDKQGRTPLHLAAWAGHAKQIALLLNFPEALRRCVVDYVALSPEILEEVKRVSLPVNKLTNVPCRFNVESTLPDEWSDGVEHNCRNYKETLPLFQQGWTALHSASARAQHHCVQLLLAAGADASAQDLLCRTPLDVAGYAHYMGYNIDPKNFKETVNLLLKASDKIQKCCYKSNPLDTPLHTAVELESEEVVEKMLLAGASATTWNSQGLTAMHLCVKKRSKELLQLLANHKSGNDDPYLATVDVKDRAGSTVLCAAVKSEWLQGVCIALGAGASITMKTDGESPIHIAAQLGNIDILQEILTVAKYNSTVDFRNEKGETALFKAISHHQLDALKLLLGAGSSIEVEISDKANVFHVAAKYGNRDVLQYLLEYNSNITAKLIHRFDNMGPPLLYAVSNNHYICAELLICKGAQVNAFLECRNFIDKDILNWTSLLHIAASKNYFEIADLIIKHDHETIHAVDSTGRTPLHEACYHGNREMIVLLLRKGADLSAASRNGITKPISILMNNLSKPTEFMQEIFDSYISSQGVSLQESNCEVVVDYGVLVPDKSNMKQMRVIKALVNTGNRYDQDRLLLHPLVQSFLYLKWKSLLPYFYSILVLHVCFVLSLNVYAISVFYYNDIKEPRSVPLVLRSDVWIHLIYLTVFLITIQEIIFIKIKSKRYLLYLETWLKFWSIALALVLPRVVSWETEYSPEWARLIATVALLLSWFEMMFLLSRFPNWGYYVLMFGKVSNKVFKILVSFVFLIFGFSVSFMIQCRAEPPFEGPWSAFVTTMVMMTSEFDYNDQLSKKSVNSSASTIILRLIFVSFLILVSIVLMNLLVGVAVNDVNNLEIIGSIKRLEKQVEFITSLEDIVFNKFIKKLVPKSLYKKWLKNKKWENVIVLRPRVATCRNCNRLPARLREAIFEKAQSQKKQSDDEQGTMLYQMKLDEIYKVIVQKNGGEPPKSESPDNALNKIIESIDKIRSDIDLIKNYIDATKRRSLCSNKSVPLLVVSKNN